MQTSPKEIRRTLDHAEASFSRALMLRMIYRLHAQHEERLRKARFNERLEALQAALHHHAPEPLLGIYRARLREVDAGMQTDGVADDT